MLAYLSQNGSSFRPSRKGKMKEGIKVKKNSRCACEHGGVGWQDDTERREVKTVRYESKLDVSIAEVAYSEPSVAVESPDHSASNVRGD